MTPQERLRAEAKALGLLAEHLVVMKPAKVTRAQLDEIIVTLRRGEHALIARLEALLVHPRPIRAHVEGCPRNFSVPVDLCDCGGRDVVFDQAALLVHPSAERSEPSADALDNIILRLQKLFGIQPEHKQHAMDDIIVDLQRLRDRNNWKRPATDAEVAASSTRLMAKHAGALEQLADDPAARQEPGQ